MTHTPGPWKAVDVTSEKTLVYRRIEAGGKSIGFAGAYKLPNKDEAEANAKLIAAAPTLYEALKPFADAAADLEEGDRDNSNIWEHFTAMNITVGDLRRAMVAFAKAQPN